ncbi:MAG: hypothetical protein DMF61_05275 [Blastocatellia bacterium AA13]|nr:MAG: hypothetical protein DMF61_05275 [Blastocatellia bacterium AA13]
MVTKKPRVKRPTALSLITAGVYLFLYVPIGALIALSFNSSRFSSVWRGFTWHWYVLAWHDVELISSLRTSLIIAVISTVISTALGTAASLAIGRRNTRRKRWGPLSEAIFYLPIIMPEVVVGFASAAFFSRIRMTAGMSTIIAAHVAFSMSYVVFVVKSRVASLDTGLEEAAVDLGAAPLQAFFTVTLPMILPAVVSAALLAFTISLDDYVITSFVTGSGTATLPVKIYSMVKTGVTPEINAISGVLLVVTVLLAFVSFRIAASRLTKTNAVLGALAVVLIASFAAGGRAQNSQGGELDLLIWSNYLPQSVIDNFEKQTGARLNVELYDSNEALLAKLQAGGGYDLVVPSDYMVLVLREQGLIQEMNRDLIPSFSNLDPALVGLPYDPSNEYSIPYLWGTTGIGYRKDKVLEPVVGWESLWDVRYSDRIAMLDDMRENFSAALKMESKSLNSIDEDEIAGAAALLARQKSLVRAYDSGGFDQLLLSGDAWLVQGYNGQIAKAMLEDSSISYVIPKQGCTISVDNLCVTSRARNAALAHRFINYVLQPEVAAEIANKTVYSSPNRAARAYIRPELLNNDAIYPSREMLDRCEFIRDVGAAVSVYDRYWTRIKSQ